MFTLRSLAIKLTLVIRVISGKWITYPFLVMFAYAIAESYVLMTLLVFMGSYANGREAN